MHTRRSDIERSSHIPVRPNYRLVKPLTHALAKAVSPQRLLISNQPPVGPTPRTGIFRVGTPKRGIPGQLQVPSRTNTQHIARPEMSSPHTMWIAKEPLPVGPNPTMRTFTSSSPYPTPYPNQRSQYGLHSGDPDDNPQLGRQPSCAPATPNHTKSNTAGVHQNY